MLRARLDRGKWEENDFEGIDSGCIIGIAKIDRRGKLAFGVMTDCDNGQPTESSSPGS